MARLNSYIKFISLTFLVSMTCIFISTFEDIRKREYMMYLKQIQTEQGGQIENYVHPRNAVRSRKWFLFDDGDISTPPVISGRPIKTKTEYPLTAALINPYVINNRHICRGVTKVSCLVMVHTAPDHFFRRSEMRRTWLNSSHYSPDNVRVIFLLGTVNKPELQDAILKENEKYNDIIQGKFLDSYRNLTNKGVLGYRWITENCMNAEIVLKVDDDAFINFFRLFEDFKMQIISRKKFIFCNKIEPYSMPILRKKNSKWYVNIDEYKSFRTFPHRYCSGFSVFITTDLVPALYHAAKGSPFFWVDDFYLFGLLPSRTKNVVYESLRKNLTFKHPEALKCYQEKKDKCHYLVMPAKDKELEAMWKAVIAGRKRSEYGYYYMKSQNAD